MVYMIVSPVTGQKVIGFLKTKSKDQTVFRDMKTRSLRSTLRGEMGDRFNYVTLENYGKGEVYPIPVKTKRT